MKSSMRSEKLEGPTDGSRCISCLIRFTAAGVRTRAARVGNLRVVFWTRRTVAAPRLRDIFCESYQGLQDIVEQRNRSWIQNRNFLLMFFKVAFYFVIIRISINNFMTLRFVVKRKRAGFEQNRFRLNLRLLPDVNPKDFMLFFFFLNKI